MKIFLTIIMMTFTTSIFAATPKCKINSLKDAQNCMNKVAAEMEEFEEPNQGMASTNKRALYEAMKSLDVDQRILDQVKEADFVGAVFEHADEHVIYYFTMTKKNGLQDLCDVSVVDLDSNLVQTTKANNFFLGLDGSQFDAYESIVYGITEFEANH